CFQHRSGWTF
nr:immunoglobulin light chain junction region [Macaca mulatta]